MINFVEQLEEFRDARRNAFVAALSLHASGKIIAGIFGLAVPREILWASDIVPVNIYSIDGSNIDAARELAEECNCAIIKGSYGYAITNKCPLTYFSDIIIGNNMCSSKASMINKLGNFKKLYILPMGNDTSVMSSEYRSFAGYLESEYNLKIDDDNLSEAIKKLNKISNKIHELLNLGISRSDILSCYDLHNIIYGSQFLFDLEERYQKLDAITEYIKSAAYIPNNKMVKRILITGAPKAGLAEKILKPLADFKDIAFIFSEYCCEGEIYKIADENKSPYEALAEKYTNIDIQNNLLKMADYYKADAIIDISLKGCSVMTDFYKHLGLPYLSIITDYFDDDNEDVMHDISSFIKFNLFSNVK